MYTVHIMVMGKYVFLTRMTNVSFKVMLHMESQHYLHILII